MPRPHPLTAALAVASLLIACQRPALDAPFTGYVEAELVYVGPSSGGIVQTVQVRRGDTVRQGQPLFALENDAEALADTAADARRVKADAQLANLRKGKRPNELAALDQQLAQAQATLAASVSALQRQQALVAQGFVSALRLEELVAARDRDAAHVSELQAERALAAQSARSDEVAAAAAEARAGSAERDIARWRLGQRARLAPADALVFDVLAQPGEWVAAGAPVVALLPPSALTLRFFVPEPALARATPGTRVQVSCDGCPAGLGARIRWVSPQAEFTPPLLYSNGQRHKLVFMVEAEPDTPARFKPGQPVDVRWAPAP